jgi:hypothetical protein
VTVDSEPAFSTGTREMPKSVDACMGDVCKTQGKPEWDAAKDRTKERRSNLQEVRILFCGLLRPFFFSFITVLSM